MGRIEGSTLDQLWYIFFSIRISVMCTDVVNEFLLLLINKKKKHNFKEPIKLVGFLQKLLIPNRLFDTNDLFFSVLNSLFDIKEFYKFSA